LPASGGGTPNTPAVQSDGPALGIRAASETELAAAERFLNDSGAKRVWVQADAAA